MKFLRLRKSLTLQFGVLTAALILLVVAQIVYSGHWRSMSLRDPIEVTKGSVVNALFTALNGGQEKLDSVSKSAVIQKIIRKNPHLRYYIQSTDNLTASYGGEPLFKRNPKSAWLYRSAIQTSDQAGLNCQDTDYVQLSFEENGSKGSIYLECRENVVYIEVAGIEQSAFSNRELLWQDIKGIPLYYDWDYIALCSGLLLLSLFTLSRVWSSLGKIARLTASVDLDKKGAQFSEKGLPLEVLPIVDALNALLRRIDEAAERQRFFLATAAHELRTPLTILRTRLEELPESETRKSIKNDLKRMSHLVEGLLHLMKLKMGDRIEAGRGDLSVIARDVCAAHAPLAVDRGIELELEAHAASVIVKGEAQLISRAISNILENAISVSGKGDVVTISVSADGCVTVRDKGPGLPSSEDASIFEPFSKFPPNRDGHGLGLAIVTAIMAVHDGLAEAVNAPDGGAIFSLWFSPESVTSSRRRA